MKLTKFKFILIMAVFISSNSTYASITVIKKKRASVELEASNPIDDSFITSLDENSMFEKVTGSYDDELDFIDELEPDSKTNKKANNPTNDRTVSSSDPDEFEAQYQN